MLRIDLLPNRVRHAITNKRLLAVLVLLLLVAGVGFASLLLKVERELSVVQEDLEDATRRADEVREIESEAQAISGRLKPIADKVDFIAQADESGYPYWDRFYEIAEYIYGGAELRFFGIMARAAGGLVGDGTPGALYSVAGPAGTDVAFGVTVKNTNEAARFILNLIRCPELSDIGISYSIPPGRVIVAHWPEILNEWGLPAFDLPTDTIPGLPLGAGAGVGAGVGAMPGADMGPGMPGEGMGPGMPGADMGALAGAPGVQGMTGLALQPRMDGPVELLITAQLNRPIMFPQPPGVGVPPAAPGAPGVPGMPDMPADMMGPPADMGMGMDMEH